MKKFAVMPFVLAGSIAACTTIAVAQPKTPVTQKAKGLEYTIYKDAPGRNAAIGDIVQIHVLLSLTHANGVDTIVLDSRNNNGGKPIEMMLQDGKFNGDLMHGLSFISPGDSAIFRISVDSLRKELKDEPMPPFVKEGDFFKYSIVMVSALSKEEAEAAKKAKSAQQLKEDDKALKAYFAKNKLKPLKTASGMYYTITKQGTGPNVAKNQTAEMNYTGKLLDGKVFDSNNDATTPFKFQVGAGQVIPGWDEGVQLLKKGSKATLYIPSSLAYGEQGPPSIGANACLIFDVTVVNVK